MTTHLKTLSALVLAAAVAVPALSMAQDRDDHHGDEHHAVAAERGAGPDHSWHKGDRVPENYRDNRYVVNDWRGHHLSEPPSGYHWVQAGNDFVLAAVATGVIADVMLNN